MGELREVYRRTEQWGQVLVKEEDGTEDKKHKRLLSEQEISESETLKAEQFWPKCKVKPGNTIIFKKGGRGTEASENWGRNYKDIPKGGNEEGREADRWCRKSVKSGRKEYAYR